MPPEPSTPLPPAAPRTEAALADYADVASVRCPACDYPLHATIAAGRLSCPECGQPIRFRTVAADVTPPALLLVVTSAALAGGGWLYLAYVFVRGVYFLLGRAEIVCMLAAALVSTVVLWVTLIRWPRFTRSRPATQWLISGAWAAVVVTYVAAWLAAFSL